jgi:hypothetical protein
MTYSSGGLIQATDYNGFVGGATTAGTINYVWSTGNGQFGYGQTALSQVSATNTVTHPSTTGLNFYIGRDPGTYQAAERTFKGKMAKAMIYNAALTQEDISAIFNAQKASFGL